MSDVAKFIEAEKAHASVIRAGYGKDATDETRAARKAAQEARGAELGISSQKAGINLISPNGELQMTVSRTEIGDARKLLAGEPLTWAKDSTRDPSVKAGDPREPSITAKFLVANVDALSNNITNAKGLDAIALKDGNAYAVAYMKPELIKSSLEEVKAVTDHTRGNTCLVEKRRREGLAAAKAEKGKEGAEMGA